MQNTEQIMKHGKERSNGRSFLLSEEIMKERFIQICTEKIKRPGIERLLGWLEKSDFYEAPASTRFHGSYAGGLLQHSLNVYDEMNRLLGVYPEIKASEETIAIVTLFHDLCKVNVYKTEQRNRKNEEGLWEKYDTYTFDEKFCFGGHGSKSMYLAQNFINLTPEEAVAINCHMGFSDVQNITSVSNAFESYPLAWLLHVADCSATYILENKRLKKDE